MTDKKNIDEKITKLKQEMNYLLTHDPTTGLPNKILFYDRLEMAVIHAHRNKERLALMMIDLDDFHNINHTYGYPAGDKLLKEAGTRLKASIRRGDTIARMGGDEFVLILPGVMQKKNAIKIINNIFRGFQQPFSINETDCHITITVGVSIFPEHGDTGDELMVNADIALHNAKSKGKNNFQFFIYK